MSIYGYCPECKAVGISRERRLDGNDTCVNGHTYSSSRSINSIDKAEFITDLPVEKQIVYLMDKDTLLHEFLQQLMLMLINSSPHLQGEINSLCGEYKRYMVELAEEHLKEDTE